MAPLPKAELADAFGLHDGAGARNAGLAAVYERGRMLARAIENPADYQKERLAQLGLVMSELNTLYVKHENTAKSMGYSDAAAKKYAEDKSAAIGIVYEREFESQWPIDPLLLASSLSLKKNTSKQVAFGSVPGASAVKGKGKKGKK